MSSEWAAARLARGRTKVLGCGTIRDKAGRMRDKPCVCWVFVAPPADGWDQDFWLAFSPHLAIFEGGLDGFDPLEKQGL